MGYDRSRFEILSPAGNPDKLRAAVAYGADAVYLSGQSYGLRAFSDNFNEEEMKAGIAYAHEHGVKCYVTLNVMPTEEDLGGLEHAIKFVGLESGADAVLISDPGVFTMARTLCPDLEIHISTQASVTNSAACNFWASQGAKRIVLAREVSLEQIKKIRKAIPSDVELECFVHGAMCVSYSGRCLLSAWFTGRDANRGACTHPCRWKYAVAEETRPGEYFPVEENERGTYIFNSRDLCMIEHLPELAKAGIDSLKIEGRMKTALYVASITRAYRRAIDDYLESDEKYAAGMEWYRQEIRKCTYRDFTTGFYFGRPDTQSMVYTDNTYASDAVFLGIVEEAERSGTDLPGLVTIHQKNKFSVGETIEIMCPDGRDLQTRVLGMKNAEGEEVQSAPHPGELIYLQLDAQASAGDILRVSR